MKLHPAYDSSQIQAVAEPGAGQALKMEGNFSPQPVLARDVRPETAEAPAASQTEGRQRLDLLSRRRCRWGRLEARR